MVDNMYTQSASRLGQANFTGDDRALFLTEFGQLVLEAWAETQDFKDFVFTKKLVGAKADDFPVIGRKRDATDHTPGDLIVGGNIEHDKVTVTVDNMLIDSVFIAEIDELLNHYPVREAYARQLGESLGSVKSRRVAQTLVLASRASALDAAGHVTPIRIGSATMKTSAAKIETAIFRAQEFIKTNDISGGKIATWWPWTQQLLLARYSGVEGGPVTTGSGNRASGTIEMIGGLQVKGTNFVPSTNITTGLSKYQGDFTTTAGLAANDKAAAMLVSRGLRVWSKEVGERLGWLMIASELYGLGILRPECGIEFTTLTVGTNVISLD